MKQYQHLFITGLIAILLMACAGSPKPLSLTLREYQTRSYQAKDKEQIFHAVLNTLQDDGFVIDVADINSGLIKGVVNSTSINGRETLQKTAFTILTWGVFLLFTDGNVNDVETVSASITISPYGKSTKVRTSFVYKEVNPDGEIVEHRQIVDKSVYQKFYAAIEKSIFYDESLAPEQEVAQKTLN